MTSLYASPPPTAIPFFPPNHTAPKVRIVISNQTGTTSSFSYDTPFLASISTIRPTSGGVTVTCPPCSLLTHTHCLTLSWSSLRLQLWCSLSPVVCHHRVFILRLTLPHHPTPCIRLHYARPLRLSRVCSPCFSAFRHSQRCLLPFIPPQQRFSLVFLHCAAHGLTFFLLLQTMPLVSPSVTISPSYLRSPLLDLWRAALSQSRAQILAPNLCLHQSQSAHQLVTIRPRLLDTRLSCADSKDFLRTHHHRKAYTSMCRSVP